MTTARGPRELLPRLLSNSKPNGCNMAKFKRSLWSRFCDAMLDGKRMKALDLIEQMSGEERESAKRWFHGPAAAQKRESAERQRAINATTEAEIRTHCQTEGL